MQSQNNKSPRRNHRSENSSAKRVALSALFVALALIFSYIEAVTPGVGIPGVKLGITNLVVVLALYKMNWKYAFTINIIRIVVSGLLFSGIFAMLYSLVGGCLSLLVMCLLKRTDKFSVVGVSMAAAVTHNFGQVLVAAFVIENMRMFLYFPLLLFSGIIAGIVIGILAWFLIKHLPNKIFK